MEARAQARSAFAVAREVRPLPERPFCTLVIPCLDEEDHIEAVVRAAMRQSYPRELSEIFVVDGGSTDRTRAIVAELEREDPRVVVLDNPGRYQSAGMNVAILRARGDVVVRMDAHADYADDYVASSIAALRRTGALNVGGAARARHRTAFQRAVCAALASPLGFGGSAYRDPRREGFVESVFNGAFRREAFELAGLYDPEAVTNEDAELNQRILEAGGRVYLSRDVVVHYYPRSSPVALARQYFAYGQGRARTLKKRGRLLSIRPVVPFAALASGAGLAAASLVSSAAASALGAAALAYAGLVAFESARASARHGLGTWPLVCAVLPIMHAAHGLGFAAGLVRYRRADLAADTPERLAGVGPDRGERCSP